MLNRVNCMFWQNRKFYDKDVGELTFENEYWHYTTNLELGELLIDLDGTKIEPDISALKQSKFILNNIDCIRNLAIKFIDEQDISPFTKDTGSAVLDSFTSYQYIGKYDLIFGLSGWDDAFIIVHFKSNAPFDISLGD